MKKISLVFVLIAFATATAFSQFGIQAGVNLANQSYSGDGFSLDNKSILSFQIGPVYDLAFSDVLYLNTGLLYNGKGSKVEIEFLGETFESTSTFNYLELPINLMYKTESGFYAKAGPYLAMAIGGKEKSDDESQDIQFGSEEDEAKAMDFGLNLGAGMDFSGFRVGLNYGLGFGNLSNADGVTANNNVISLVAAYYFAAE